MEKEKRSQRTAETDFMLQWGSKKRLRCVKLKKEQNVANKSRPCDSLPKKKLASRFAMAERASPSRLPKKLSISSPEKEDRYYTTRGSLVLDDNGKGLIDDFKEDRRIAWPKLVLSLSTKEKEEDFMMMKGCKPSQRPKKRAKLVQRTLLLVSPGAWLSDLCQERYEVREKKSAKKRPKGLKAMGSMESESE